MRTFLAKIKTVVKLSKTKALKSLNFKALKSLLLESIMH